MVGIDERQHAGWRRVTSSLNFRRSQGSGYQGDASHKPAVQEGIQLVGASSQHAGIADDRGFIRWAALNPHRAVVGEQQSTLEVCRGEVVPRVAHCP